MEDGARTLREQRAAYVGMQEWASEDAKRGGTADFWKSVPAIIMIAGSFFKPKGKELYYVLFFIELALSAEEVSSFIHSCFQDSFLCRNSGVYK